MLAPTDRSPVSRALAALAAVALAAACTRTTVVGPAAGDEDDGPAPPTETQTAASCDGQVVDGNAPGGVEVRRDRSCTLDGVVVQGDVKALRGSTLVIRGGSVTGNVQSDRARSVEVRGAVVGGDVQIDRGQRAWIEGNSVGGDIQIEKLRGEGSDEVIEVADNDVPSGNVQVEDNRVTRLRLRGNDVGGGMQVFKNRGDGSKDVSRNTIAQNLQCKENASPFTNSGPPNVAGKKEDQCRDF
jgi:hypothetical protein